MSAFGSSISRFASSPLTGYGGKFKPNSKNTVASKRTLTQAEELQVRNKLKAAAYTDKGVDWHRLFQYYDRDNSGEIGMIEFKRLLRADAKISVSQLPDNSVRALYNCIDTDNSGEIDANEFLAWVNGPEDTANDREENEEESEWGESTGYGRVSPRRLHSPSQRRFDAASKGWVTNNDENSLAEAAILRRQGSALAAQMDQQEEETVASPSSTRTKTIRRTPPETETTEQQLAKLQISFGAFKSDYAKQEKVLKEALATIEFMTKEKDLVDQKLKEQRRTIAVINRRSS